MSAPHTAATLTRRTQANLALCGAIVAEVIATVSLKGMSSVPALVVLVIAGYCSAFVLLAVTLRCGKGIGAAYGIWGASGVVLTAIASALLYAEAITPIMAIGFVCIALGVVVVEVGAERVHRSAAQIPGVG